MWSAKKRQASLFSGREAETLLPKDDKDRRDEQALAAARRGDGSHTTMECQTGIQQYARPQFQERDADEKKKR